MTRDLLKFLTQKNQSLRSSLINGILISQRLRCGDSGVFKVDRGNKETTLHALLPSGDYVSCTVADDEDEVTLGLKHEKSNDDPAGSDCENIIKGKLNSLPCLTLQAVKELLGDHGKKRWETAKLLLDAATDDEVKLASAIKEAWESKECMLVHDFEVLCNNLPGMSPKELMSYSAEDVTKLLDRIVKEAFTTGQLLKFDVPPADFNLLYVDPDLPSLLHADFNLLPEEKSEFIAIRYIDKNQQK